MAQILAARKGVLVPAGAPVEVLEAHFIAREAFSFDGELPLGGLSAKFRDNFLDIEEDIPAATMHKHGQFKGLSHGAIVSVQNDYTAIQTD